MNESIVTTKVQPQDSKELTSYRLLVERLADTDSKEVFKNDRPEHAAIIFDVFLRRSREQLSIFCNKLCDAVFNDPMLVESLTNAVNRKVRIRVVTQIQPVKSAFLTKLLALEGTGLVFIHNGASTAGIEAVGSNFAVMDSKAYRYEPAKSDVNAFACMNNPETSSSLLALFDKIFEASAQGAVHA